MKKILLVFAILFCVLSYQNAFSSHITGGEITYEYVDANGPTNAPFRYKIIADILVDTRNSTWNRPMNQVNPIRFYVHNGAAPYSVYTDFLMQFDTSTVQPELPVGCSVPALSSIHVLKNHSEKIINLPFSLDGFYVVWDVCCRIGGIRNLSGSINVGNTFITKISPSIYFNNSPQFSDEALPFICEGDTTVIVNNAIDPDGDKLVYSFVHPYDNKPTGNLNFPIPTIPYNSGFDQFIPFGNGGYAAINSNTGLTIYKTPNVPNPPPADPIDQYTVVVEIKEYREVSGNSVLINTTRRELQILSGPCPPNPAPTTTSTAIINNNTGQPANTTDFIIEVGESLDLSIQAFDNDTVEITGNGAIIDGSNGSFIYTGNLATFTSAIGPGTGAGQSANFSWTPDCDVPPRDYIVNVNVKDRGCPPKNTPSTFRITVLPFEGPEDIFGKDTVCTDDLTQLYYVAGSASSTYNWKVVGGTINTNTNNDSITVTWNASASNPSLKIIETSGLNCSDSLRIPISFINRQALTAGPDKSITVGGSTTITSSGSSYGYFWSPATGLNNRTLQNPTASPTVTTTYYVRSLNAASCTNIDSLTVFVNNLSDFAGPDIALCSGESDSLGVQPISGVTYSWSPSNGLSSTTVARPVVTLTNTGTAPDTAMYFLTITDTALMMNTTDSVLVIVFPAPPVNITAGQNPLCAGSSTILTATGAVTYEWFELGSSTVISTNDFLPYNQSATATFVVEGTDANGCVGIDTFVLTVIPTPIVNATASNDSLCRGESTQLSAAGAANYEWYIAGVSSSFSTSATVTVTPNSSTVYVLVGTDASGCSANDTLPIFVSGKPNVQAAAATPPEVCIGSSVQLSATGVTPSNYTWSYLDSSFISNQTNITVTPLVNTAYLLVGTNAFGCQNSDTVRVTINPLPIITATTADDTICAGTPNVLTANGGVFYRWTILGNNTGLAFGSTYTVSPTVTTTYVIAGTNNNGCTNRDTVTVNVNPLPTVTATVSPSAICPGDSSTLTASGAISYTWKRVGVSTSFASGSSIKVGPMVTTTYEVQGTNANGCINTAQVTVTLNTPPTVTATASPDSICPGSTSILTATGATGYSWTVLGNSTVIGSNATLSVSPASTTSYVVKGTDANGCVNKDTVKVTVNPLPNVNATADKNPICVGSSTVIRATGASSYVWRALGSATVLSNADTLMVSPTAASSYILTGTDAKGCVNRDTIAINLTPLPIVVATTTPGAICTGATAQLSATGAATYKWFVVGQSTSFSNSATASVSPIVTTSYALVGTSTSGCSNSDTITVTVNPLPAVSAPTPNPICVGGTAQLTASGASSYSWTQLGSSIVIGTTATISVSPTATTSYVVAGTDANTCVNRDTVTVTVNPLPTVVATPDSNPICFGDSTVIRASGAVNYVWTALGSSTTLSTADTLMVSPTSASSYVVTGTDANGCVNADTLLINVTPLPLVNANTSSAIICDGSSTQLTATGASTYVWFILGQANSFSSSATTSVSPSVTTSYVVVGTAGSGCSNSDTVTVTVNPLPTVAISSLAFILCEGGTKALSATGAASYEWFEVGSTTVLSNSDTLLISPTVSTTYVVIGTDINGCVNSDTAVEFVNPLPTVVATPDSNPICFGDSTVIRASGAVNYVWTALGSSTTLSTADSLMVSPTSASSYVVTGTSVNGCVSADTLLINVTPLPVLNASAAPSVICSGGSTLLSATITNPLGNYSWYILGQTAPFTTNTTGTATVSPTITTDYVVINTSTTGCINSDTVTVTVNPLPTVTAVATPASYCTGGSSQLTASGASSYSWTALGSTTVIGTTASITVSPTVTTSYVVTGTDANSCENRDTVSVTVHSFPLANAGSDVTTCSGDTALIFAQVPLPAIFATTFIPNIVFTNGTGDLGVLITNNGNTPIDSMIVMQVANITTGCTSYDTMIVTVNPTPVADAGSDQTICSGETILVGSVALSGYTYSWAANPGLSATNVANPSYTNTSSAPVTETLTVTANSLGCSSTDQVIVTTNPTPATPVVVGATSICPGAPGVAYWIQNGTAGTIYNWSASGGTVVTTLGDTVLIAWGPTNPAASVSVTATNSFACTGLAGTLGVNINPILNTQTPFGTDTLCLDPGTPYNYGITPTNGSTYNWGVIGGNIISYSGDSSSVNIDWTQAGTGRLWVVETTKFNNVCLGVSDTLYITAYPSPDNSLAINGPMALCEFESGTYNINSNLTGSNFAWSITGGTITGGNGTNTITVDWGAAGGTSYGLEVIETSQFGCTGSLINTSLQIFDSPDTDINGIDSIVCASSLQGNLYTVSGMAGSTFSWTIVGGTFIGDGNDQDSIIVDWDNNGTRSLSVLETSANNCQGNQMNISLFFEDVQIDLLSVSTVVSNEVDVEVRYSVTGASGANNVQIYRRVSGTAPWILAGTSSTVASSFVDANQATDLERLEYKVEVDNSCDSTLSSILHNTILLKGLSNETTIDLTWTDYIGWENDLLGYQILRSVDGSPFNIIGQINNGLTFKADVSQDGFNQCFRIRAITTDSLYTSLSNIICVDFQNDIMVANIITDNDDGKNDVWKIRNIELYPNNSVRILNRWGKEVYSTTGYNNTWGAKDLPAGVYYYELILHGNDKTMKGYIQLTK